jgi:hypothetical protein
MSQNWIRLKRAMGKEIPTFYAFGSDKDLFKPSMTSYSVRWDDGTVGKCEMNSSHVFTMESLDKRKEGIYYYFEVPFNGMMVVYNLDDVELLEEEVVASPRSKTKKQKKAA